MRDLRSLTTTHIGKDDFVTTRIEQFEGGDTNIRLMKIEVGIGKQNDFFINASKMIGFFLKPLIKRLVRIFRKVFATIESNHFLQ